MLGRLWGGRDGWGGVTLFSLRNSSRKESSRGLRTWEKDELSSYLLPSHTPGACIVPPLPGLWFSLPEPEKSLGKEE